MKPYFVNSGCVYQDSELLSLLHNEIKNNKNNFPSPVLKTKIESYSREERRELVRKERDGVCALFCAGLSGNAMAAEYLVTVCNADMEQKNLFEVEEEKTFHNATALWASAVANHLNVVKLLVRLGANINSLSDSGSSAVRSACFMSNIEVVQFLINAGADFSRANFNGGTCLINSVQSIELCKFLLSKGVDVNARDIQNKTALHYAIQEYRLETTKILIEHGSNVFLKSRYGDDALQTASLKGAHEIFEYLKSRIYYTPERLANAYELIGTTVLTADDQQQHNNHNVHRAITYWRQAIDLRQRENIPKEVSPSRSAFNNILEFRTHEELNNIAMDLDDLRMTALVISERILGSHHRDFLFRLLYRGAFFADSMRYDSCLKLWLLSLETRIERNSILHSDSVFVAQAITRLMLNLNLRDSDFIHMDMHALPTFAEAYKIFQLLTTEIVEMKRLLRIRPVYKKQQDNFDKVLKCITHIIYLMLTVAANCQEKIKLVYSSVYFIVKNDIRTSNQDSLLHMCVSRLNYVKHGYFQDHNIAKAVFPNTKVVEVLLKCGSDVNARNECRSTALFIASNPYNYNFELIETLLKAGAELDYPNKTGDRPINLITSNVNNKIPIVNYLSLKCFAATAICKFRIPYKNPILPKTLEKFVQDHQ